VSNLHKIVTVIQARMGSTRLPGKVMLPLDGKPLLQRMYERVSASELHGYAVVATSTHSNDDIIYNFCKTKNIEVFRGHPDDLLDRHYKAGIFYNADAVVKIPSDCPLISPSIIDKVIRYYLNNFEYFDYVSNLHPATYPDGNDVEVIKMSSLQNAWENASKIFEREHTTPYIWERPEQFRIGNVLWETGLDYSMSHRWTIDYHGDYNFIKAVYEELSGIPLFEISDILNLLELKPHLSEINKSYNGVNWYRHHLDQLTTISSEQTRYEK